MNKVRVQLNIRGRVQGVFFRQSTRQTATRLGLTGWARNCPDGSVEVVFEGDRQTIDAAIEWCRIGPAAAVVSGVEVNWMDYVGEFDGFGIRS